MCSRYVKAVVVILMAYKYFYYVFIPLPYIYLDTETSRLLRHHNTSVKTQHISVMQHPPAAVPSFGSVLPCGGLIPSVSPLEPRVSCLCSQRDSSQ